MICGNWVNQLVKEVRGKIRNKKELTLSHQSASDISFIIEVDPTGNGDWMEYLVQKVKAGEKWTYEFPKEFQARWIRFSTDADTKATAWLTYK